MDQHESVRRGFAVLAGRLCAGGHEFDTVGESPSETAIIRLVVDFFVRTLVFHRPITSN